MTEIWRKIRIFAIYLAMKRAYKILRILSIVILALIILVPSVVYIALSLPSVQNDLRQVAEKELSTLLNSELKIEKVSITPFNRLTLFNVTIKDDNDSCAIKIDRLGAGVNLTQFISTGKYVVNYVELMGLNASVYRDSISSPLNIQGIIQALQPKEKNKPPTRFDFQVNTIVIRNTNLSYDILNKEKKTGFDINHLGLSDFKADIRLPRIKNDDFSIDIKRLSATEKSGFILDELKGNFHISNQEISVSDLTLLLPASQLKLGDIAFSYNGWDDLKKNIKSLNTEIKTNGHCYFTPSDFKVFLPYLADIDNQLDLQLEYAGSIDSVGTLRFGVSSSDYNCTLFLEGSADSLTYKNSRHINISDFSLDCRDNKFADLLNLFPIPYKTRNILSQLGSVQMDASGHWYPKDISLTSEISTSIGSISINTKASKKYDNRYYLSGNIKTPKDLKLNKLLSNENLGVLDADIDLDITSDTKKHHTGYINSSIPRFTFKGYEYQNITAGITFNDTVHNANLNIADSNVAIDLTAELTMGELRPQLEVNADLTDIRLDSLNLFNKYPGYSLSAKLDADLTGRNINDVDGIINVTDFRFTNNGEKDLILNNLSIETHNSTDYKKNTVINSDFMNANIAGIYDFKTIGNNIMYIASMAMPSLFTEEKRNEIIEKHTFDNDIAINIQIDTIVPFIAQNIELIDPITITGHLNNAVNLELRAPCIKQKNKLYENSKVLLTTTESHDGELQINTRIPIKRGLLTFDISNEINSDKISTDINWDVLDKEYINTNTKNNPKFHGQAFIDTHFNRDEDDKLITNINIKPSELTFNDTIWTVEPANISVKDKHISVNGFNVHRENQHIKLSGDASPDINDILKLKLSDVNLDYVFESLAIPNVAFGGNATGTFVVSNLFDKAPILSTDEAGLYVENLSYNYSRMGNAKIDSHWDNEKQAVYLYAKIDQDNNRTSYVTGHIWPLKEELDFHFDADKINVGFMKPFMIAFTSDVQGYASGKANLYGTFKYIDMTGDIFAEDLKLKLDFTNTYYSATDNVHLEPGRIELNDITLTDINGNTAKLNGWLTHECFKRPKFSFNITDAKNLLCYDVPKELSPIWYGHVIGSGYASVTGVPGLVEIKTDITTGPNSKFTFELSDAVETGEYNFITFKDRNEHLKPKLSVDEVKENRKNSLRLAQFNPETPITSNYKLEITANVTEDAEVRIIMDPKGGDYIKSFGNGRLTLGYESQTNNLSMTGDYKVISGDYHFTLQDIIVKDFKLRESSISFNGDPYAATLDINAVYTVNANLTDLDEAFATDKEVANTNVAIDAIMEISGDMRKPNTRFRIEAPKMSSDTQTRINSIVNASEDMMSRQIIYLLALNRFYTPDYMNVSTNNNELLSVASSTLSSRLGSMLSQINENITIAPNLRSSTGDFSDVQFDLALSSTLLNNRLRLNGNLGYRDKSLNTNTFVGDFDVEYLINRSGNIRLKAYNRYNDRNFYIKTAATTQGVGVLLKHDFDNIFDFLKPIFKHNEKNDSTTIDKE